MKPSIPFSRVEDLVSKKRFVIALAIVIGVHLLLYWLWKHAEPEPNVVKKSDLVIDLGKPPPSGAVGDGANEPPPSAKPPLAKAPPAPRPAPATADVRTPPVPVGQAAPTPSETPTSATSQSSTSAVTEPAAKPDRPVSRETSGQTVQDQEAGANAAVSSAAGSAKAANDAARTAEADYKAAYLNNPRPAYPRMAHRMGIEGTVILLADVNEEGLPVQVRVFQTSGNDLLDQSALNAVNQWRFSPARKEGVIVRSLVKIPITFSLKNQAKK